MGGGWGRRERGRVYEAYEVKNKRQKLRCLVLRRKKIYLFIYEVIKTETGRPPSRERTRHVDTRVHYLRELVRDDHVKLLKCAGPQNVADAPDQKPFASSPFQTSAIHVGHTYSFFSFLSLSRLDGPRRRPTISSHHADTKSQVVESGPFMLHNHQVNIK